MATARQAEAGDVGRKQRLERPVGVRRGRHVRTGAQRRPSWPRGLVTGITRGRWQKRKLEEGAGREGEPEVYGGRMTRRERGGQGQLAARWAWGSWGTLWCGRGRGQGDRRRGPRAGSTRKEEAASYMFAAQHALQARHRSRLQKVLPI